MEAVYPDLPGVSGVLLIAWRRRPGSPVAADNNERVFTVAVKRAYTVAPSTGLTVTGTLSPDPAGPKILEADTPPYESDLAAWKPEADLIVLPAAAPVPLSIAVAGVERMRQPAAPPPVLGGLGWEAKVDTPRTAEAGSVTAITQTLPDDFRNRFFNGYRRNRATGAVPWPGAGQAVQVTRAGAVRYGFVLPADAPVLRHHWYVGHGRDDPSLWRARTVAMELDTLVVEPDANRAYCVWRGTWPVDFTGPDGPVAEDANRRIVVTIGGA